MNVSDESLKVTNDRKVEVLSPRTKTRIGFWNVRTMYETGKLAQVTAEMRRYNLHILGISESRWTGSGRYRTNTGETVLYSGRDDDQHQEGVAVILRKGMENCLMEWKPINSRLMKIRMKGKHINITIIQCYAPTNDSEEESKDAFYDQLQAELERTPCHEMKIVMGDLNAKVGSDNTNHDRAMGKEGCGSMNNNGERLLEFCTMYDLVIGGTLFPHREIHKLTWCSPNGRDKNQIDHLMINGTWRRSLQDVRVRRGADVGSDHHLVTATLKLKLRRNGPGKARQQQFDIRKLMEPRAKSSFTLQLKNKFQALADAEAHTPPGTSDINTMWEQIRVAYTHSSEACLGCRQKKRKEWITSDTWQAIEGRRALKKKVMDTRSERLKERYRQQYREADRTVKRMTRADKRAYMEDLASQAEEAANRGEQGQVYKITKLVSGKYRGATDTPIVDKQGRLLTTEVEKEARWVEHFSEVLNRPPPTIEAEVQDPDTDLDVSTAPPEKEEIITAIRSLKNGKAPGQDSLNAELFKAEPEIAAQVLQPLFVAIWEEKQLPDDLTEGVIVKIPKKGALSNCNNWREITLLSVPSKILAKPIIGRISIAVDQQLRQE